MLLEYGQHSVQTPCGYLILRFTADKSHGLTAPLQQMFRGQFSRQPVIDIEPAEMAVKIRIADHNMRDLMSKSSSSSAWEITDAWITNPSACLVSAAFRINSAQSPAAIFLTTSV